MTRDSSADGPTENSTDESLPKRLARRDSLKLGGVALAAAATGFSTVGAAQKSYEVMEIPAGEVRVVQLGSGERFEDTLVDASAEGAGFRIEASGSDWAIRNVGITGPMAGSVYHVVTMNTDGTDGTGTIDNVYMEDVPNNFLFCSAFHEGHIDITDSTFINNDSNEDLLYGSPPGNPDAEWPKDTGRGGTIRVENCYGERIDGYGFRLGSGGSEVVNSTLNQVQVGLANLYGRSVEFHDVDVVDASLGLRLGDHVNGDVAGLTRAPRTVVRDVRISADRLVSRNPHNGNPPELVGTVEGDPDPTPPATAPMSAVAAASGPPDDERGRGPPEDGNRGRGPPENGNRGRGPPEDGNRGRGPSDDGNQGHGPPEDGDRGRNAGS